MNDLKCPCGHELKPIAWRTSLAHECTECRAVLPQEALDGLRKMQVREQKLLNDLVGVIGGMAMLEGDRFEDVEPEIRAGIIRGLRAAEKARAAYEEARNE